MQRADELLLCKVEIETGRLERRHGKLLYPPLQTSVHLVLSADDPQAVTGRKKKNKVLLLLVPFYFCTRPTPNPLAPRSRFDFPPLRGPNRPITQTHQTHCAHTACSIVSASFYAAPKQEAPITDPAIERTRFGPEMVIRYPVLVQANVLGCATGASFDAFKGVFLLGTIFFLSFRFFQRSFSWFR